MEKIQYCKQSYRPSAKLEALLFEKLKKLPSFDQWYFYCDGAGMLMAFSRPDFLKVDVSSVWCKVSDSPYLTTPARRWARLIEML